jgi:spore maturation protein CgeB
LHTFFSRHSFAPDLKVDISNRRLDREGWAAFLNNCLGTVSSEAGSWYLERNDATMEAIREWTAETKSSTVLMIPNDSPLRKIGHKLPWFLRVAIRKLLKDGPIRHESAITENLDFNDVFSLFFKERPTAPVYGKCISSRHFDAIGTHTCQILLEGRYNDILLPNQHYIALKSDFSNIEEVMDRFRDPLERNRIVEDAYNHIRNNHTYADRLAVLYEKVSSNP